MIDTFGWVKIFGVVLLLAVLIIACETLIHGRGALLVWLLSQVRIRTGERRALWQPPPHVSGGPAFYRQAETWYICQNCAGLVGLIFWVMALIGVFGYGIFSITL